MPKRLQLENQKFTYLTVLSDAGNEDKSSHSTWLCQCVCGSIVRRRGASLIAGKTRSCGCLSKEKIRIRQTIHGESRTPEMRAWMGAKHRCYSTKSANYKNYGGRGIKMCDEWLDKDHGYENFLANMGRRPSSVHSLDRIDVNGDYSPKNCQWALRNQQIKNRRKMVALQNHTDDELLAEVKRRGLV